MIEAGRVTEAVDVWLREEVRESGKGRNRVLDDQPGLARAYQEGETRNDDQTKASAHYSRFVPLMQLRRHPEVAGNDQFLGKIIHHSLMFASGGFRRECMLLATDQQDYLERRFGGLDMPNGASSVDISEVVSETLGSSMVPTDLDTVVSTSLETNQRILDRHLQAHAWLQDHATRIGQLTETDLPIVVARERQGLAIGLAVSHIALVALERGGDLAQVPFLEPKSISDTSQPYYPFK